MSYYQVTPDKLLVFFDDADLPLGTIRFRDKGGSGGHNGIRSLIDHIGPDFNRLRVGIGRQLAGREGAVESPGLTSHVLGRFSQEEKAYLETVLKRVVTGVEEFIRNGIQSAMAKFNQTPARE